MSGGLKAEVKAGNFDGYRRNQVIKKTLQKTLFNYLLLGFLCLVSVLSYTKYYSLKLRSQIKELNNTIEQEHLKKQDYKIKLQTLTRPERIKALASKYLPEYSYTDSSKLMEVAVSDDTIKK